MRPEVTAKFFPRCDLYSAPSIEYQYIKYAICEVNLYISRDPKLNPNHKHICNPNPFPILSLCHSHQVFHITIKSHLGKTVQWLLLSLVSLGPTKHRLLIINYMDLIFRFLSLLLRCLVNVSWAGRLAAISGKVQNAQSWNFACRYVLSTRMMPV